MHEHKRRRPPRGYALMFVLAVGVALGVVVSGLFALLVESGASAKQTQEELQQLYGCDGALRLASDEVRRSGNVDVAKIEENLRRLADALQTDIDPGTGHPYADIDAIEVKPEAVEVGQVGSDPFFGIQFVREGSEFVVIANPKASRGRTCRAQSPNRLRTISYFEFARVSLDTLDGGGGNEATLASSGDIYTLEHTSPFRRLLNGFGFGRRDRSSSGPVTVNAIRIADNETFRPVPPSGQPWSFINKKKGGFLSGTKRRMRHKRPIVEYFTKWPTNTPTIDPTLSRFAMQADLRIVDGHWFLNDRTFPGVCAWSDRPSGSGVCGVDRNTTRRLQYSAYETKGGGKAGGGAAIVRYGITAKDGAGVRRPVVGGVCPSDKPGFVEDVDGAPFYRCPDASGPLNALDPDTELALDHEEILEDPYVAAARTGFFDPYEGDDGKKVAILPLVLDVAALAAAMNTTAAGELGALRCLDDDDVTCPENRRFRGALWIGTTPAGVAEDGGPRGAPVQPLPDGSLRTPCPLLVDGSTTCVRPNAVVIVNADNLEAFVHTGLSIASNLPIYVVGNVNSATPAPLRTARISLMAPVITGLSSDFDFGRISYIEGRSASVPSSSQTLEWHTSLFTSWTQDQRNPARNVLRRLQSGVNINVTGSMVAMFRRGDYDKIQTFNSGNGSFSSPRIDPMVAGLPIFEVNPANVEELGSRAASGTLRFPAESGRDLRRAKFDKQPPASPRFSIDLAPVDRR